MPFTTPEEYQQLILSYVRGDADLKPLPKGMVCKERKTAKRAEFIVHILKEGLRDCDKAKEIAILQAIAKTWTLLKSNGIKDIKPSDLQERMQCLRQSLCQGGYTNWKNALLSYRGERWQNRHFDTLQYEINAAFPLVRDYANFLPFYQKHSYTLVGSSFKTNRLAILKNAASAEKTGQHALDALYAACDFTHDNVCTGISFGLADGSGGHFGEAEQDKIIAKAAYTATKHASRLLGALSTAKDFDAYYPTIVSAIADEMRSKIHPRQEGATLVAGKAFIEAQHYCVKGFNIGDSLLAVWEPESQQFTTLAPASLHITGHQQAATAIIPVSYQSHEIHPFQAKLTPGAVLLVLSDGVHDYLPSHVQNQEAKGLSYQEKSLDALAMTNLLSRLPKEADAKYYVEVLTQYVIAEVERLRLQKLADAQSAYAKKAELEKAYQAEEAHLQTMQHQLDEEFERLAEDVKRGEIKPEAATAHKKSLYDKQAQLRLKFFAAKQPLETLQDSLDIQIGDDVAIMAIVLPPVDRLVTKSAPLVVKPGLSK